MIHKSRVNKSPFAFFFLHLIFDRDFLSSFSQDKTTVKRLEPENMEINISDEKWPEICFVLIRFVASRMRQSKGNDILCYNLK